MIVGKWSNTEYIIDGILALFQVGVGGKGMTKYGHFFKNDYYRRSKIDMTNVGIFSFKKNMAITVNEPVEYHVK